MKNKPHSQSKIANIIYLHEMDELLGGDGLNAYDMMYVVSNDIKWHKNESDLDEWIAS